jgi:hypothetical protein
MARSAATDGTGAAARFACLLWRRRSLLLLLLSLLL